MPSFPKSVTMVEARARFSELVDAVFHRGEHVEIRRHGKVVARLLPPEAPDRASWHRATSSGPRGLQGIAGVWAEVPNEVIDEMVRDIYEARERDMPRPFDFASDEE